MIESLLNEAIEIKERIQKAEWNISAIDSLISHGVEPIYFQSLKKRTRRYSPMTLDINSLLNSERLFWQNQLRLAKDEFSELQTHTQ
jgi:hypothetical protein